MSDKPKAAVFYHCWYDSTHEPPPYQNMRTPVLISIATLRAHTGLPIYVIDLSAQQSDWSYFPKKLDFQVHHRTATYIGEADKVPGWRHLSRIPDIHALAIAENIDRVIYSDSDVFWFGAPNVLT